MNVGGLLPTINKVCLLEMKDRNKMLLLYELCKKSVDLTPPEESDMAQS